MLPLNLLQLEQKGRNKMKIVSILNKELENITNDKTVK